MRESRGLTLDNWDDLSLAAKYEMISVYRSGATMQTWEGLGPDGRREAIEAWELKKSRKKEKTDA